MGINTFAFPETRRGMWLRLAIVWALASAPHAEANGEVPGSADRTQTDAEKAKELEHRTQQIYNAEGYSRPLLWTDPKGHAGDTSETARLVNAAEAWNCEGNPPRCHKIGKDTEGVVYHGKDTTQDHKGMGTRWLGGPTLTLDNIWTSTGLGNYQNQNGRLSTAWMTVPEGASPTLGSGVHEEGKPYRLRWAFNKKPLYDHTNGLPDNGERNHHTEFWISYGFNLNMENVTARDTGTYTAAYTLRQDDPILETQILLTVQYLPKPKVFGKDGRSSTVYIKQGEKETTATCLSAVGEPEATMTWLLDGTKVQADKIRDASDTRRIKKTIIIKREDIGALLTCKVSNTDSGRSSTASVKVKGTRPTLPLVQETKKKVRNAILQPATVAILTATAITGLVVGITGAVMMKRKWKSQRGPRRTRAATTRQEPETTTTKTV